jgi:aspartate racemase
MEESFYRDRLRERHGIGVIVPDADDREAVHRIIYDELCVGRVVPASRQEYRAIIGRLIERGAQAVILGCTEITLLVDQSDSAVPLFDTTAIHAEAAALYALAD